MNDVTEWSQYVFGPQYNDVVKPYVLVGMSVAVLTETILLKILAEEFVHQPTNAGFSR